MSSATYFMHHISADVPLQIDLFGQPKLRAENISITGFVSARAEGLFYYLVSEQRTHSRESLATLLWPEEAEQVARTNLRTVLSNLRKVVGDRLTITRQSVRFDQAQPHEVDTLHFKKLLADEESTIEALKEALALYRAGFLKGITISDVSLLEQWITIEREHLHTLYLKALSRLAQLYKHQRSYASAIEILEQILALEPLDQDAHHQLMSTLARSGKRNEALAHFEECRQLFLSEFGVEPLPETVALFDKLQQGITEVPSDLPTPTTPCIGRESELSQIYERLAEPNCRLLSLVALGGTGKTRTAVEAARNILGEEQSLSSYGFEDGIFFVPLNQVLPTEDAQAEQQEIIKLMGRRVGLPLEESALAFEQSSRLLRTKQMLIILDQAEHLQSMPAFVDRLLRSTFSIKLLVTSRVRLGLHSEWVVQLRGLTFPDSPDVQHQDELMGFNEQFLQCSCPQLLLRCAERHDVEIDLSTENKEAITSICQSVDGSPLGIELASTWLPILSLTEIANELSQSIDLVAQPPADERIQRSMKVTYDHSWRLLSDEEQGVLRQLAYFPSRFTREAAVVVTNAEHAMLAGLHAKSLLTRTEKGYFLIHDTLRQYIEQYQPRNVEEETQVRDAHCRHYFSLVVSLGEKMQGEEAGESIRTLEGQITNIQTAWHHALATGAVEIVWPALHGLRTYFNITGQPQTGSAWWSQALGLFTEPSEIRGTILACQAESLRLIGQVEAGLLCAKESREVFTNLKNEYGIKQALIAEGFCLWTDGRHDEAWSLLQDTEGMIQPNNERDLYAQIKFVLGLTFWQQLAHLPPSSSPELRQDLFLKSKQAHEEALTAAQELGNIIYVGYAYAALGPLYMEVGLYEEAYAYLQESQAMFAASDHSLRISNKRAMADIYIRTGEFNLASQTLAQAIQSARTAPDANRLTVEIMVSVASWVWRGGNLSNAAQLMVFLLKHPLVLGRYKLELRNIVEEIREQISPISFQLAETRGSLMSVDQATKQILGWFQEMELDAA